MWLPQIVNRLVSCKLAFSRVPPHSDARAPTNPLHNRAQWRNQPRPLWSCASADPWLRLSKAWRQRETLTWGARVGADTGSYMRRLTTLRIVATRCLHPSNRQKCTQESSRSRHISPHSRSRLYSWRVAPAAAVARVRPAPAGVVDTEAMRSVEPRGSVVIRRPAVRWEVGACLKQAVSKD
jgi:hypothetical protein